MYTKKILVTGSSRGIGFVVAKQLSKNKRNTVYLNGRHKKSLEKAKKVIENCEIALGDVNNNNQLKKIGKKIKNLDILICNIGNGKSVKPGKEKKKDWERSFNENFYSTVNVIKEFEKKLIKSKGVIICMSSICGIEYIKGAPTTYSVSKAALNAFVRSYSKFLGPKGVRLNAIAPGNILVEGSTWEEKMKKNENFTNKFIKNEVSLKTFGSALDVNNLIEFLITDKSKFINGSIFVVDGGQIKSF